MGALSLPTTRAMREHIKGKTLVARDEGDDASEELENGREHYLPLARSAASPVRAATAVVTVESFEAASFVPRPAAIWT